MDVHAASRPVWPITIPRGLYLSGEHWGSHEQSTWSIFMCYNLSISHQSEYIPFLKSSIAVGFTTVIRHESPHISTIFHCWDGADQTWMPLPLSDWPISYFWLFYEHRTPSNSVVTHHISSLSPFRLLYIELGRYLYIYIYIYVNMHSPMSGQTCYIWFHHLHIQIRIQIQIQMHMKCLYTYIKIYPVDTCRCCMTWMNENSRDIMIDIYIYL